MATYFGCRNILSDRLRKLRSGVFKAIKHEDIRSLGSKNAGTTNMFRVFGLRMGALTFLCDALKGVIPSLVCRFLFADADVALTFAYWSGLLP